MQLPVLSASEDNKSPDLYEITMTALDVHFLRKVDTV